MALAERIKKLRRSLELTQQEFADRIGVKRNTVATYEMGRSAPSDAALSLICREFGVSETWLRTGEGEMYQRSADAELEEAVNRMLSGESAEFRRALVQILTRLTPEQWERFEGFIREFAADLPPVRKAAPSPALSPSPDGMTRAELHAELDRQLDEQEKNARESGGTSGVETA